MATAPTPPLAPFLQPLRRLRDASLATAGGVDARAIDIGQVDTVGAGLTVEVGLALVCVGLRREPGSRRPVRLVRLGRHVVEMLIATSDIDRSRRLGFDYVVGTARRGRDEYRHRSYRAKCRPHMLHALALSVGGLQGASLLRACLSDVAGTP